MRKILKYNPLTISCKRLSMACIIYMVSVMLILLIPTDSLTELVLSPKQSEFYSDRVIFVPTPIPTPTPEPTPVLEFNCTFTETPIHVDLPPETEYHIYVLMGIVDKPYSEGDRISTSRGVYWGPSGRETYYNLRMDYCVSMMRDLGWDEEHYPYWVREDGAKMLGPYVMVAANWSIRPKGTIIETSLGSGIVVDTGSFVSEYPYGVDIAVDW